MRNRPAQSIADNSAATKKPIVRSRRRFSSSGLTGRRVILGRAFIPFPGGAYLLVLPRARNRKVSRGRSVRKEARWAVPSLLGRYVRHLRNRRAARIQAALVIGGGVLLAVRPRLFESQAIQPERRVAGIGFTPIPNYPIDSRRLRIVESPISTRRRTVTSIIWQRCANTGTLRWCSKMFSRS